MIKARTYKSFEGAAKASKKLNTLALLYGFNKKHMFLVYSINRLVKGVSVSTWVVGTRDYTQGELQSDDMFYVVHGKRGLEPYRVEPKANCEFF
jgi:hypothetical protein